jgi:ribosome biogenesis protein BMS1
LQKRAVVLEPHERKAVNLLNELNAIRNAKATKRREANDRRAAVRAKEQAKEREWREKLNKERKKDRWEGGREGTGLGWPA